MGRRGYPAEFRRKVLDLIQTGHGVADVARDLPLCQVPVGHRIKGPLEEGRLVLQMPVF